MLSKSNLLRALTILALLALFVTPFNPNDRALASQPHQAEGPTKDSTGVKPVVLSSVKNDISPALREMKPPDSRPNLTREIPFRTLPKAVGKKTKSEVGTLAVVQNKPVALNMPAPLANFEGVSNVDLVLPPDTNGDIGVDPVTGTKYYMQWVNLSLQIWDVTNPAAPVSLYGPVGGNTLFDGFGGPCEISSFAFLFCSFINKLSKIHHPADRWLSSGSYFHQVQFGVSGHALGVFNRNHTNVFAVCADQANLWNANGVVHSII